MMLFFITVTFSCSGEKEPISTLNESKSTIGYWPFNGNANDESGNGNNGIRFQVVETQDRFGNLNSAYYFDGNTSYIDIKVSNLPIKNTPRTISGWFKADSSLYIGGKPNICIFNYGEPIALQRLSLYLYSKGYLNTINGSELNYADNVIVQKNYIDNKWHFFALVYNGEKLELFVDGESFPDNLPKTINLNTSNSVFRIGKKIPDNGINENFKGSIDDITIYNRALSKEEINNLYKK
jgi:hypothetical protein